MGNKTINIFFWSWNFLHYKIYMWHINIFKSIEYINPFYWIAKLPIIENHFKKKGIKDFNTYSYKLRFGNEKEGANIGLAGGIIGGITLMIELIVFNLFQGLLGYFIYIEMRNSILSVLFWAVLFLLPSGLFNYYVVFRKDKYLYYFKEFGKLSKVKSRLYSFLSFVFILIVLITLTLSFIFLLKNSVISGGTATALPVPFSGIASCGL